MNYFRYKQLNNDVITVAVGFTNMLLFCIKIERKSIKNLTINGVLMRHTLK